MKKLFIGLTTLLFASVVNAQTITKIQYDSLPVPVRAHVLKKYSKYKVAVVQKSVDTTQSVSYLVELRLHQEPNMEMVLSLVYNVAGILTSSKKDKEIYYTGNEPVREMPHNSNDGHNH